MKVKYITISEAEKAYEINRSTLTSWVTKKKVRSEKRTVGKKETYYIEVDSLESYIKERGKDQPSNSPEEANAKAQKTLSLRGVPSMPKARKKRPKHRRRTPYQRAINSIRSLSTHDLLKIAQWIPKRVDRKIEEALEPEIQPDGKAGKTKKITKDKENGK